MFVTSYDTEHSNGAIPHNIHPHTRISKLVTVFVQSTWGTYFDFTSSIKIDSGFRF